LIGAEEGLNHGGDLEAQGLHLKLPRHGAQLLRFQIV
jgi:hypothetical protein